MKITIFYPLEEQPVPLEGAEDLWLGWLGKSPSDDPFGNFHSIDSFADIVMDSGYPCPLGDIFVDYSNGRKETRDTFVIKAGETETVFAMTDYRVICKDGVWGWEVEAEVQPCQHKTTVTLVEKCNAHLELCTWGCDKVWLVSDGKEITLDEAGCPRDYWPGNCIGRTDAAIEWFLQDYEVQP